jgi:hypothetical protein
MPFPASDGTRWKQFLTQGLISIDPLFCYHAAPGQDNPSPSVPTWAVSWIVVSCGVRLSVVGSPEIRKPQVEEVWEPQAGGLAKDRDRRANCAHFVLNSNSL